MELPVDERLLAAQYYLIEQRKLAMARKRQLYEQFRAFALNKLKTYGQPFEVRFRSIDGDPGLKYKDVDMGDEFHLVYGSFMFDPKTNLMTNYIRNEFRGTKTDEDFNKMVADTADKLRHYAKLQQTLDHASELEIDRINRIMHKKVDKILMGIFKGELGFSDPAFKTLVEMNIALEKELQELNTRIAAVSMLNGSSEVELDNADDKNIEPDPSDKRMAIVEFLNENLAMGMDPTLAVVALSQQEEAKTM